MSDIERVFARLGGGTPGSSEQRELRNIPRKGGMTGSRVVEVVRLPSKGGAATPREARRTDHHVRAQSWDEGFPAHAAAAPPMPEAPPEFEAGAPPLPAPKVHVMPMWERSGAEPVPDAEPVAAPKPKRAPTPRGPVARTAERRVADPFDADDDGANCMRCGYVIEPAREKRGLMTCESCG